MSARDIIPEKANTDEPACWVSVYLDGDSEPVARYKPPGRVQLDTRDMADGEHKMRIEAMCDNGTVGVREIDFRVRNGPAIEVHGLKNNEIVDGDMSVMIHAFSGSGNDDWEPSRAEAPTPIPTWVWVLFILIFAAAMFYTLHYWSPSGEYLDAPTWQSAPADGE